MKKAKSDVDEQPSTLAAATAERPDGWQGLAAEELRALAWLHACERSPETLVELYRSGFPASFILATKADPAHQAMTAALAALAGESNAENREIPASSADDLAADYANIYLNHALRASPHESVWRDEDNLMLQAPTFAVRDFYRRHHIQVADWRLMADDHISHELNFLALLLERDEEQEAARFLHHHLLAWVPDFAQRAGQRAATPFYAALALLTNTACQQCSHWLPHVSAPAATPAQPPRPTACSR